MLKRQLTDVRRVARAVHHVSAARETTATGLL
jgi:hypothetical protein